MTAPATGGFSARDGWHYGLMGLPLAFVALPLYVHLPHLYGQVFGLSLTALGAILLTVRLLDAVIDPWLGQWCDQLFVHGTHGIMRISAGACGLLALGMWALLIPPHWARAHLGLWLALGLVVVYLAFSLLTIAHQSWGARLGGSPWVRARIVSWREGLGLVGVVGASVLPSLVAWDVWAGLLTLSLALAWWMWRRAPRPAPALLSTSAPKTHGSIWAPWRHSAFRRLITVFVVNGSASAVPATLVLFFIQDRLGAKAYEGIFLAIYFVCAAASLPLWLGLVKRQGLVASWGVGMALSVLVFAWVMTLGQGDLIAYAVICALSGAALGADLAIPTALLAVVIAQQGDEPSRTGAYFGWWHVATKLNLALAAGVSLPLLAWLGYVPGQATPAGLGALSWVYGAVPCVLKIMAAWMLWRLARAQHRALASQ